MQPFDISSLLQGWPAIILWLLGGGSLYKILEKVLDNRDKAAARDAVADGERAKSDAERIKDLQEKLIPLAERAALALHWEEQARNCQAAAAVKDVEHQHALAQKDGDARQLVAVLQVHQDIAKLLDDDEGRAFLRRRFEAKRTP